jgi:alpha-glucosidase
MSCLWLAACGGGSSPSPTPPSNDGWWRDKVVYEVFVRSFADSNGDGIGSRA